MVIDELKTLRSRIIGFQNEASNEEFDKWLITQYTREDVPEFYHDLIAELVTELEILQVEAIEAHQPELRKTVHYSPDFVEEIVRRIDAEVRIDTKLTQPMATHVGFRSRSKLQPHHPVR